MYEKRSIFKRHSNHWHNSNVGGYSMRPDDFYSMGCTKALATLWGHLIDGMKKQQGIECQCRYTKEGQMIGMCLRCFEIKKQAYEKGLKAAEATPKYKFWVKMDSAYNGVTHFVIRVLAKNYVEAIDKVKQTMPKNPNFSTSDDWKFSIKDVEEVGFNSDSKFDSKE
jgi:hypothetical protein